MRCIAKCTPNHVKCWIKYPSCIVCGVCLPPKNQWFLNPNSSITNKIVLDFLLSLLISGVCSSLLISGSVKPDFLDWIMYMYIINFMSCFLTVFPSLGTETNFQLSSHMIDCIHVLAWCCTCKCVIKFYVIWLDIWNSRSIMYYW